MSKRVRARFLDKCSSDHVFWGSVDLALARYSGRGRSSASGGDRVTHEVSSCGFWPGSRPVQEAAFYAYMVPEPADFPRAAIRPASAWYSAELGALLLRYEDVRGANDPDAALREFLQCAYEAAAAPAGWDRPALERQASGGAPSRQREAHTRTLTYLMEGGDL